MARRQYVDYPDSYLTLLTKLQEGAGLSINTTWRQASSLRHSFYRYFRAIREAALAGDRFAQGLDNTARNIVISIEPSRGRKDDPATIYFQTNPLETINALGTTVEHQRPKPKQTDEPPAVPFDPDVLEAHIERLKREQEE